MHRKLSFCLAAAFALSLLAGCGDAPAAHTGGSSAPPGPVQTEALPEKTPGPTAEPTPEQTPEPTPTPTPEPVQLYEFGVPVEEGAPVEDDSFFDNAVFLGDSRTEGLELFSGLKHGSFYWARGMNVFRADDEEFKVIPIDGQEYSVMDALRRRSFDTVYIMIGVNELGYPAESYEAGLSELIDKIIEAQPDAVVYLQIMPPLNDAMCRKTGIEDYINNDTLKLFNEAIVRVATEKKVALLNTAEVYTGEDGQLPEELAYDGCHFAVTAYSLWADYLRSHVLDRELYFSSRETT